jgi:hypothetical protein
LERFEAGFEGVKMQWIRGERPVWEGDFRADLQPSLFSAVFDVQCLRVAQCRKAHQEPKRSNRKERKEHKERGKIIDGKIIRK